MSSQDPISQAKKDESGQPWEVDTQLDKHPEPEQQAASSNSGATECGCYDRGGGEEESVETKCGGTQKKQLQQLQQELTTGMIQATSTPRRAHPPDSTQVARLSESEADQVSVTRKSWFLPELWEMWYSEQNSCFCYYDPDGQKYFKLETTGAILADHGTDIAGYREIDLDSAPQSHEVIDKQVQDLVEVM